jgi:coenzyme F420-0:L-glutamate ligase/coenzyme F420-1:gamma-L-glutamate ligase
MKEVRFCGLESIPEVEEGDDLARVIYDACLRESVNLSSDDVVIVTSKIVSKAEGRILEVQGVTPSRRARAIAKLTGKNPVEVEIVLRESEAIGAVIPVRKIYGQFPEIFDFLSKDKKVAQRVVDEVPALLLTTMKDGSTVTDAGLDYSNNPPGKCTLLPLDANDSAASIGRGLRQLSGAEVSVVVTDSEVAFTHLYGSMDIALGSSGIRQVTQLFGAKDRFGREKFGGADVVVDELAGAAALLMGQTAEGVPVVIAKNLKYEKEAEPVAAFPHGEVLSRGIWLSILSTLKLRLARLLEPFV